MATKSTTYYQQTDPMLSYASTTQRLNIGKNRETIAQVNDKGLTFYIYKDYKIRLSPSAVHVMNTFLTSIHEAVELLKTGKLREKYTLPLGARIFLEIDPNYRCVSIRKFFRPKSNPNLLLPGSNGIGLKLEEFIDLENNWYQLLHSIPWEEAECCYFNDPNQHKDCQLCWY